MLIWYWCFFQDFILFIYIFNFFLLLLWRFSQSFCMGWGDGLEGKVPAMQRPRDRRIPGPWWPDSQSSKRQVQGEWLADDGFPCICTGKGTHTYVNIHAHRHPLCPMGNDYGIHLFLSVTTHVSLLFSFLDFSPFQKRFTSFMSPFDVSEFYSSVISDLCCLLLLTVRLSSLFFYSFFFLNSWMLSSLLFFGNK